MSCSNPVLLLETHPDRYRERMQITRDEGDETIYSHYRQRVHSWILMIRQTAQSAALCDQQSTRHTVLLASTPPAHIYTSNGTIKIFTSVVVGGRRRAGQAGQSAAPSGMDVCRRRPATPAVVAQMAGGRFTALRRTVVVEPGVAIVTSLYDKCLSVSAAETTSSSSMSVLLGLMFPFVALCIANLSV